MDADLVTQTLDIQPAWEQRRSESKFEYAWFVRYAELGAERTVERVAALCGVPVKGVRQAAKDRDWDARVAQYDATIVEIQKAINPSEDEALAVQYAAGTLMLKLGLKAIQLKNPALIKVKDIQQLLQMGAEMVRRGAGVADLKVEHSVVDRVEEDIRLLLGEG